MTYRVSEFAKLVGVTSTTLRRWHKSGKLVPDVLESGHRIYTDRHYADLKGIKSIKRLNIIYCRKSTKNQKSGLEGQEERLREFCNSRGLTVDRVISEFGSGLNYKRKGLQELVSLILEDQVETLVIYHKDRLVRFGFEMFEFMSVKNEFSLIVLDNTDTGKSKEQEFAEDLISIIHYFSMKLYGSRTYKQKVKSAVDNIVEIKNAIA